MKDLFTITCPSCGAQPTIQKNTFSFTCDYCGQHHVIQVDDIEFYARCPLCKRNDKVEKLTAISKMDVRSQQNFSPPKHPDEVFIYNPDPQPEFIPKPEIPKKPEYANRKKATLGVFILILIAISSVTLIFLLSKEFRYLRICFGGVGLYFFINVLKKMIENFEKFKSLRNKRQQEIIAYERGQKAKESWLKQQTQVVAKRKEWEVYKKNYDREFQERKATLLDRYSIAMEQYNALYYCQRDDCIFIPDNESYAPISKINEYINYLIDEA
jgi:predicted RNA-binding Zn-ribbon protein involved in translation (DUF1610 family)